MEMKDRKNTRRLTREEDIELKENSMRRIRPFLVAAEIQRKESFISY